MYYLVEYHCASCFTSHANLCLEAAPSRHTRVNCWHPRVCFVERTVLYRGEFLDSMWMIQGGFVITRSTLSKILAPHTLRYANEGVCFVEMWIWNLSFAGGHIFTWYHRGCHQDQTEGCSYAGNNETCRSICRKEMCNAMLMSTATWHRQLAYRHWIMALVTYAVMSFITLTD